MNRLRQAQLIAKVRWLGQRRGHSASTLRHMGPQS